MLKTIVIPGHLKISFDVDETNVTYKVVDQSDRLTRTLQDRAEYNGYIWGIKSMGRPAINKGTSTLYVRGTKTERNADVVEKSFDSVADVTQMLSEVREVLVHVAQQLGVAVADDWTPVNTRFLPNAEGCNRAKYILQQALRDAANTGKDTLVAFHRLISSVRGPDVDTDVKCKDAETKMGTVTKVRQALYTQGQAKTLCLSGNKEWPTRRSWTKCRPCPTKNVHFAEHLGQAVHVLNQAD